MTETGLIDAVIRWVRAHAQMTNEQDLTITPDTDLFTSGLLDSYDFIELILYVESLSGCKIDLAAVDPRELAAVQGLCKIALGNTQKGAA